MVASIAEIEFYILLLAAFLRAALIGIVERLSVNLVITSRRAHGAIF